MYSSNYYSSNYYASRYYGVRDVVEEVVEEIAKQYAGGGSISGRKRRLLKQIKEEDEIIVSFISSLFGSLF